MRRLVALAVVLPACLVAPAPAARASTIVYRCGEAVANLCTIDPDGTGRRQLTEDGEAAGPLYVLPSISRDGRRLSFSFGNALYVTGPDPNVRGEPFEGSVQLSRLSPDGARVAFVKSIDEGSTSVPYLFTLAADGSDRQAVRRRIRTVGWLGDRLLTDSQVEGRTNQVLCLLRTNDDFPCERLVADDPTRDLHDPDVTPDGTTVVATAAPRGAAAGVIAAFSAESGALLRELTDGPDDSHPALSPDGRSVVFDRGRQLFIVPLTGGVPRFLADGIQAAWGGSAEPPSSRPAPRNRRERLLVPSGLRAGRPFSVRVRLDRDPGRVVAALERRVGRRFVRVVRRTVKGRSFVLRGRLPRAGGVRLRLVVDGRVLRILTIRVRAA